MFDPGNIKEWAPLEDLLSKIPVKSGLLKTLDQTCIAVLPEFIALGTDFGMVLWYNRAKQEVQKLRTEQSSSVISCLELVDSVEFMVACGDDSGKLTIFQIEKEHPPDVSLLLHKKPKPIERYTVKGVHKHMIKSLAWSKNGMKLFSGDKSGVICLTEIDYQNHTSHSREIINEFHEIVQLSIKDTSLLCSTTFRTIICHKQQDDSWNVLQVGKKDRKTLCKLGAAFLGAKKNLSVITTRPGYRFWLSDVNGNVTQTLIFKEELTGKRYNPISLLNPSKYPMTWTPLNFGLVYPYGEDRIITCGDNVIYLINLKTLKIERVVDQLRGVIDIAINYPEIFILETPRSVIRISTEADMTGVATKVSANFPLWRNDDSEDNVDAAEECLDLPPITPFIPEGVPKALEKSHELVCRKLEQFRQIDTSNDDPILFETRRKKSKDRSRKSSTKTAPIITTLQDTLQKENKEEVKSEIENIISEAQDSHKTSSTYMDVSIYSTLDTSINKADMELKERELAKELEIEPIFLEPIKPLIPKQQEAAHNMTWSYPNATTSGYSTHTSQKNNKKPLTRHFVFDEFSASVSDDEKLMEKNLSDDMKNVMIRSADMTDQHPIKKSPQNPMSKSMYDTASPVAVLDISDYMKIPNLWNKMEKVSNDAEVTQELDDSVDIANEWEIV